MQPTQIRSQNEADPHPVILFDGVCGLCNTWVDFTMRHDPMGRFRFSPLQSPFAAARLGNAGIDPSQLATIVLLQDGQVYRFSTAVLRILRGLGWPWAAAYAFVAVPRPIRDGVYRFIAKRRYRWFGKKEACRVPTPEERDRFIL